jgi:hypothetical protein
MFEEGCDVSDQFNMLDPAFKAGSAVKSRAKLVTARASGPSAVLIRVALERPENFLKRISDSLQTTRETSNLGAG